MQSIRGYASIPETTNSSSQPLDSGSSDTQCERVPERPATLSQFCDSNLTYYGTCNLFVGDVKTPIFKSSMFAASPEPKAPITKKPDSGERSKPKDPITDKPGSGEPSFFNRFLKTIS